MTLRLRLVVALVVLLTTGLVVFGVLRSGDWGFLEPKPGIPLATYGFQ